MSTCFAFVYSTKSLVLAFSSSPASKKYVIFVRVCFFSCFQRILPLYVAVLCLYFKCGTLVWLVAWHIRRKSLYISSWACESVNFIHLIKFIQFNAHKAQFCTHLNFVKIFTCGIFSFNVMQGKMGVNWKRFSRFFHRHCKHPSTL